MARAKAYIMPGEEDFGIAPVEANACGRPVVAFAAGGALDVQVDGETGVLFREQTVDSLCAAMERLDSINWDPQRIRENAMRFDTAKFREKIATAIASTEVGDRRKGARVERRQSNVGRAVPNERRRVLMEGSVPVWYDRRHHGEERAAEAFIPHIPAPSEQLTDRRATGQTDRRAPSTGSVPADLRAADGNASASESSDGGTVASVKKPAVLEMASALPASDRRYNGTNGHNGHNGNGHANGHSSHEE
jgi:hypothetical protein